MAALGIGNSLLLALMFVAGCSNRGGPTPAPAFIGQLYYKSPSGANLLDPLTPGHLNKDEVTILDLVRKNGIVTVVASKINVTDSCANYVCQSPKTGYYLDFVPDVGYEGTIVRFGSSRIDTLSYETVPMNSTSGVSKVLYKNQAIWTVRSKITFVMKMTITD
jgi:hypothetical protein